MRQHISQIVRVIRIVLLGALLIIFIGKIAHVWWITGSSKLLYIYGISVTLAIFFTFAVTYLFYKDPYEIAKNDPAAMAQKPLVSYMVAVFNEEDIIEQCIVSLLQQTYSNSEIIIVNDCSQDNTKAILDKYAEKGLIRAIHLTRNVGKKNALAVAIQEAKGEIFAFSDSDSVWSIDAIEKIVPIFTHDPDIGAVSGHCRALNANSSLLTRVQDTWYEGQFSVRKAFESVFGAVTCVSGPLAVFRRSAVYNYIPAWINDRFLGQDFLFATDRTMTAFVLGSKFIDKRLKQQHADSPFVTSVNYEPRNWKIVYCKAARAWTQLPDTLPRVIKQQIRWKKSFIRNIFFMGAIYWRKPLIPALYYYLHIVFVLLGPIISFRHLIYLPITGDVLAAVLYLAGIIFVGLVFGIAFKLEDRRSQRWMYRPLMSLLSTFLLSWLVFYSALTIRKMVWTRD